MSLLLSDIFPEFLNVGSDRLAQLSGGWLQTPVAKECGVERVAAYLDAKDDLGGALIEPSMELGCVAG